MVQPTSHAPEAGRAPAAGHAALPASPPSGSAASPGSPPSGEPSRPEGVGLIVLLLAASNTVELLWALLHLWAGTPTPTLQFVQLTIAFVGVLEFFVLFHFWKGKNWARILVLLTAFFFAVQSTSLLVEHNFDPTVLMRDPVRFLRALLAIFLLYWLNTPPLRAWFKKMSATAADLIAARLVGRLCTSLDVHSSAQDFPRESLPSAALYRLTFEHSAELTLSCPWRIVLDDNLAFAHAPAAGSAALPDTPALSAGPIPYPSSDPDEARRLLQNLRVTAVRLAPHTSDLFLTFEMGIELQTWNPAPAMAPAPAAGSAALPPSPHWTYSDPVLTVIAGADGLISSQLIAPPADQPAND